MKGTWQKLKTIIAAMWNGTRWNLLPTGKDQELSMDHCSIHVGVGCVVKSRFALIFFKISSLKVYQYNIYTPWIELYNSHNHVCSDGNNHNLAEGIQKMDTFMV